MLKPATDLAKELPIWISETYSQPVSIGSVTMMASEWLKLALQGRDALDPHQ